MLSKLLSNILMILLSTIVLLSCSNQKSNSNLATFNEGSISINEYIDHYLLSTQYKPKKLPSEENLKQIVLDKALEKMAVQEAYILNIDEDSLYLNSIRNNERNVLFRKYVELEITNFIVTDSIIQKFYAEFSPQFRMQYIMRPFLTTSTEDFINSQKASIDEAYKKLESEKSFKDVAEKYSQDISTNKKGGDLGWIIRESMGDEALRKVMDTLPQFTYSKPFKGFGGYYILRKGKKREVEVPDFESAKQKIWKTIYHSRKAFIKEAVENRFDELAKKYNYNVSNGEIEKLFLRLNNNSKVNDLTSLEFSKLNNQDLKIKIAEYKNNTISIGDLFATRKRLPSNKKEFNQQFKNIAQQHLFSTHAKELNFQNEPKIKSQLSSVQNTALRLVLIQRVINDKVKEQMSLRSDINGTNKVKIKSEYEKTITTEFENKLKSKYKFKFEESNFSEALKVALQAKEKQTLERSAK